MTDKSGQTQLDDAELDRAHGGLLPAVKTGDFAISSTDTSRTGDTSGNTVFIGSANGGVWKTTNG